ncbi:MAG: glycosyltransferase family 4 protein [Bacteroidetes bacterium]|nr:glycosyltransferase family 4 protein [Bacteroidota bacterium]
MVYEKSNLMKGAKKKILMFGWEFPPVISGGLGVATLGLCKALAPLAYVQMVIPRSVPGFSIPNINLIGLNNFTQAQLDELFSHAVTYDYQSYIGGAVLGFGPYTKVPFQERVEEQFFTNFFEPIKPFEIEELYAGDVLKKVMEFARIAVQYGLRQEFDIIHAHDWMTFLPAMELKRLTGKPMVLHVHSTEYDRSGPQCKNWVYQLEKRGMHMADFVIPVSYYTGSICAQHYGVPAAKIMPVHNGVEPIVLAVKEKPFKEKVVLFFGRITMQKGPEVFVEAAKIVLQKMPNVRFVMAGNGDQLNAMIELSARYGLGDRFSFTGFLSKQSLNELLAIADVYCMPSVSEPFGLSAVEAVQYHIPTIISKTSGVAEVLNGSLNFDVNDTEKFAQCIIAALNYQGLKESIVKSNAESLKTITWEHCAKEVMKVYGMLS